jgi:serine/threonine-protein kinase HipA
MAKSNLDDSLWVWLDDPAFGPPQHIGTLSRGNRDSVRFAYERTWLQNPRVFQLDPSLGLSAGDFYPESSNFGVFLDSCPDRWGQTLMRRRETVEAKEERRAPRTLTAWDFLQGVQDFTRMGALRFSAPQTQTFLANEALSAPPVTKLAELQAVALELTRQKIDDLPKLKQWLKVLVAPGASLGGARPKANLVGENNSLWIAKFPSADDERDVALWEMFIHDLARKCGIDVPEARLERIGRGHHTFLVKRFDRDGLRRKFFTSAMTLLGKTGKDEASYLELAQFIATHGSPEHINQDLAQLFTRVVFNVAIGNRDDHLRNHGFMQIPEGRRLANAYDMNPSIKKDEHELALDTESHAPSLETVLSTAALYRLDKDAAVRSVQRVLAVLRNWKARAKAAGIPALEAAEMDGLFLTRMPT